MEIIDPQQKREFEQRSTSQPSSNNETSGRIFAGLIVIAVGGLLLAQKFGYYFPDWLFSWQTLIIAIGFFIGAKHNFRPGGWLIPILIGSLFLLDDFMPEFNLRHYLLPIILIAAGMLMILTPNRRRRRMNNYWQQRFHSPQTESGDDVMNSVAVFGGNKRNIISKNFKGGESVSIFGGTEINLMQADIQGKVTLELVQIFGGTKLILPANWQVQSDMVSIFGDVQDSRVTSKDVINPDKILVIKGVSLLGGISIKSY